MRPVKSRRILFYKEKAGGGGYGSGANAPEDEIPKQGDA